jgi:hypothetical protein
MENSIRVNHNGSVVNGGSHGLGEFMEREGTECDIFTKLHDRLTSSNGTTSHVELELKIHLGTPIHGTVHKHILGRHIDLVGMLGSRSTDGSEGSVGYAQGTLLNGIASRELDDTLVKDSLFENIGGRHVLYFVARKYF